MLSVAPEAMIVLPDPLIVPPVQFNEPLVLKASFAVRTKRAAENPKEKPRAEDRANPKRVQCGHFALEQRQHVNRERRQCTGDQKEDNFLPVMIRMARNTLWI